MLSQVTQNNTIAIFARFLAGETSMMVSTNSASWSKRKGAVKRSWPKKRSDEKKKIPWGYVSFGSCIHDMNLITAEISIPNIYILIDVVIVDLYDTVMKFGMDCMDHSFSLPL